MEFVCEYCGKTFTMRDIYHNQRFCSKSCAAKGRCEGNFDKYQNWKKDGSLWQCPYNEGVHCQSRVCHRCGWNPEVAQMRSEKIQEAKV
jgi:hypothetical protein